MDWFRFIEILFRWDIETWVWSRHIFVRVFVQANWTKWQVSPVLLLALLVFASCTIPCRSSATKSIRPDVSDCFCFMLIFYWAQKWKYVVDFAFDFWMLACSVSEESISEYAMGRLCLMFWTTAFMIFEICKKISFMIWKVQYFPRLVQRI
jgi:hypothetical protein